MPRATSSLLSVRYVTPLYQFARRVGRRGLAFRKSYKHVALPVAVAPRPARRRQAPRRRRVVLRTADQDRLEALAAVRLFDLLAGEAEQREALEPILIRSAEHDAAATWRLAASRGARGDCEGQREVLVALTKREPAAVDAARELIEGCDVTYT